MWSRDRCVGVAVAVVFAAAAFADETTVVTGVFGPEGPLYVDGKLYYVGWISNTLSKWDGRTSTVLNSAEGCGHNGLALTRQRTFLIACTNDPGAIIEVDMAGKELRRWSEDADGRKFDGGINDIVVAANGAYATVFGPFVDPPTVVIGRVLYLPPGGGKWIQVADDLDYANGVGISPDQKTLYVNEAVGNSIKKFVINDDGTLARRSNFALLNEIAAGDGTTNVAFGPEGKDLYVTVVKDPNDPKAAGVIVKVANVR